MSYLYHIPGQIANTPIAPENDRSPAGCPLAGISIVISAAPEAEKPPAVGEKTAKRGLSPARTISAVPGTAPEIFFLLITSG
jgi:hypothetical protein